MLFFYPLDFTFVCPTEIIAFSERIAEFKALGAEVGCSGSAGCNVQSLQGALRLCGCFAVARASRAWRRCRARQAPASKAEPGARPRAAARRPQPAARPLLAAQVIGCSVDSVFSHLAW